MSEEQRPKGALNTEVLAAYFEKAGFPVREMVRDGDNLFRLEYNFPDATRAAAMRSAFAKNGGDIQTYYRYLEKPHNRGELQSRERVYVPYESDEDLREFFNAVMDDYTEFMAEADTRPESQRSAYSTPTNKRTLAGRI